MKEYIFINRVPAGYGAAEAKEVAEAWKNLTDQWKQDEIFVTSFVFPGEASVIAGNPGKVSVGNILTEDLKIVSVIVIKAIDNESATFLANASPTLQQSGTVEVREIMIRPS